MSRSALMLVSNDVAHDARVLKEAATLRAAGFGTHIIGWAKNRSEAASVAQGTTLLQLPGWSNGFPVTGKTVVWTRLAAREARIRMNGGYLHAHDLDGLMPAAEAAKASGARLLFDAHELFSDMVRDGHPVAALLAARAERRILRHVHRLITVTEPIRDHYAALGVTTSLVRNCPVAADALHRPLSAKAFSAAYAGVLIPGRFLAETAQVVEGMPGASFQVAGRGILQYVLREHSAVSLRDRIPPQAIPGFYREADVVVAMLDPKCRNNALGMPGKVYEAMAVGRPVITTRGTFSGDFVERTRCGLAIEYTPKALRNALEYLREDIGNAERLGLNGLREAREHYLWSHQEGELLKAAVDCVS